MAKFTMVEAQEIKKATDTMLEAAAKALDIKDMSGDFTKEKTKADEAVSKAVTALNKAADKVASDTGKEKIAPTQDEQSAASDKAFDAIASDLNPLYVFATRVGMATDTLNSKKSDTGEVKEEDVNAFKKSLHAAHNECVQGYQKEGNKSAVEYMKAAGLAFVGALLAIVASPVLLFSADRRQQLVGTFFSGVHSDKSRAAQAELKNDITPFVTTAAPTA